MNLRTATAVASENLVMESVPSTGEDATEKSREVTIEENWSRRRDLNPRPADYEEPS
jgi:hypothetical protein